ADDCLSALIYRDVLHPDRLIGSVSVSLERFDLRCERPGFIESAFRTILLRFRVKAIKRQKATSQPEVSWGRLHPLTRATAARTNVGAGSCQQRSCGGGRRHKRNPTTSPRSCGPPASPEGNTAPTGNPPAHPPTPPPP